MLTMVVILLGESGPGPEMTLWIPIRLARFGRSIADIAGIINELGTETREASSQLEVKIARI